MGFWLTFLFHYCSILKVKVKVMRSFTANISQTVTNRKSTMVITYKTIINFRLTFLYLTLAHSQGHGRFAPFDCEYFGNGDR